MASKAGTNMPDWMLQGPGLTHPCSSTCQLLSLLSELFLTGVKNSWSTFLWCAPEWCLTNIHKIQDTQPAEKSELLPSLPIRQPIEMHVHGIGTFWLHLVVNDAINH